MPQASAPVADTSPSLFGRRIEPVTVIYGESSPGGARTVVTPNITPRPFVARLSYINSCTGLSLSRPAAVELLRQMGLDASEPIVGQEAAFFAQALNAQENTPIAPEDLIHILVPPSRPDILHECDIMEDAAVAYGFNNLKRTFPATSTVAKPFPINKLGDVVRRLCAEAGWIEVLPLTLCSHDENYKFLNRVDPGKEAVVLANPKTQEYQIIRTSLLPGILKTIRENRKHALPLKVFEVGDIVIQDAREERRSRNVRRAAGIFCGRKAGFEMAHGLLDRLMLGLGISNIGNKSSKADAGYYIAAADGEHPTPPKPTPTDPSGQQSTLLTFPRSCPPQTRLTSRTGRLRFSTARQPTRRESTRSSPRPRRPTRPTLPPPPPRRNQVCSARPSRRSRRTARATLRSGASGSSTRACWARTSSTTRARPSSLTSSRSCRSSWREGERNSEYFGL